MFSQRSPVGSDAGLAAGATAGITFLAIILVAFVLVIVLLIVTIRNRSSAHIGAKLVGFLPLPLLIASAFVVAFMIQERNEERRQSQSPPKKVAPITAPVKP